MAEHWLVTPRAGWIHESNAWMQDSSEPNLFTTEVQNCAGSTISLGIWTAKVWRLEYLGQELIGSAGPENTRDIRQRARRIALSRPVITMDAAE